MHRIVAIWGRAPTAFDAASLTQRGYQLATPAAPVDPSTTRRGLYFVGEARCDVAPTVADPGSTGADAASEEDAARKYNLVGHNN